MSRGGGPGGGGPGGGGRRHGHRHGRPGGPGGWGFQGWGPPRGPRARRGDVRAALLALLAEEPRNGYQLMQEIGERCDGAWTPSPGSVYPALQQLEDEGLVAPQGEDRKLYTLTDDGRAYVESRADELGTPWEDVKRDVGQPAWDLMNAMRQIGMALFQIAQGGTRGPAGRGQAGARRDPQAPVPDPRRRGVSLARITSRPAGLPAGRGVPPPRRAAASSLPWRAAATSRQVAARSPAGPDLPCAGKRIVAPPAECPKGSSRRV